jgi:predicted PurR-regulated permease PerM
VTDQERAPNRTLFVLLTIAVSIYLLEKIGSAAAALGNVLLLLALAWLVAFTLRPAVERLSHAAAPGDLVAWVRRRYGDRPADRLAGFRLSYGLAVMLIYLLLLAVLVFGVLALVPIVTEQVGELSRSIQQATGNLDLPGSFQRIIEWLNSVRETLIRDYNIDPTRIPLPSDLLGQLGIAVGNVAAGLGQFVLDLLTGIATFLSQVLLILLISGYIMIDGRSLTAQLYHLLPDRFTDEVRLSLSTIDHTFGGFMRGTLLQAFIYGVAVTVLMLVFDLQFAVVVGVACGVLMLVPIVGGVIGLALPLLTGLLQSSPYTLLIVVLLFAFQLILFNLIMPRILSQSLRMPTLLVFVALIVGGQLLGIWGLLFAVPAVGALYSIGVALLHRAKYQTDPDAPHAHRHA